VIGQFRYSNFKSRLNSAHHLLVCLGRHECDRKTFGSETASTPGGCGYFNSNGDLAKRCLPDTVEVTVSIRRTVVIYNNVDAFHIDAPTEDIRSDEDAFLECLESSVAFDTINRDMNITSL